MATVGTTVYPVSRDQRYRVTLEHTGHEKPHWVFRFCDEFMASSQFKSSAVLLAIGEHQRRIGSPVITAKESN